MYIVDKKVFLHIPKCGGSSFRTALKQRENDISFSSEHFPIYLMPDRYKSCARYTIIREPISWYKSFYSYGLQLHFNKNRRTFNMLAEVLIFDNLDEEVGFGEFVKRAVDLKSFFDKNSGKLAEMIFETKHKHLAKPNYFSLIFEDYTDKKYINDLLNTSLYQFFINDVGAMTANHFYILGEDNSELYNDFGIKQIDHIHNKGKDRYTVKSVTDESIALVQEAEKDLYNRFNFKGVNK